MAELPSSAPFLLVAAPTLLDPNFRRTVVLVLSHGEDGTYGLVLNRPLERSLADVLESEDERGADVPLHQGGPVQGEVLQVLGEGTGHDVLPGVGALAPAGDLDGLLAQLPASRSARAYLGYAGWSRDQLAGEFDEGAWILAAPDRRHVFDVPADKLWATVLWELGGRFRWMAMEGGDPELN